jgi:2-succinyl-6-hydroxy-2,4-cyclohexadiene-1-carboxylate synthase
MGGLTMMTILLHGFWGQPADWNTVLQNLPLGLPVHAPDLHAAGELSPHFPLKDWAQNFWRWVDESFGREKIQLVGYSMGARLAVTAAVAHPERVERALFLSGNPIFAAEHAADRAVWEKQWSENFLTKEWLVLESTWQEQAVFSGAPALERRKSPELREVLGLCLSHWSPRQHPFSRHEVAQLSNRMDWAFGASDQKYLAVAKSLQELPVRGQISIIPNAGHRLIVEGADFVSAWIQKGTQ